MKQSAVKYFGYYDSIVNGEYQRFISPAAVAKMDYVAHLISQSGFKVEFVSMARKKKFSIFDVNSYEKRKTEVEYIYGFGGPSKLSRILDFFIQQILLFIYLIANVKRSEVVVVYHSLGYGQSIWLAKYLKGFRVVLEVEEIYNDVIDRTKNSNRVEMRNLAVADAYIFSTAMLCSSLNLQGNEFVIVHGSYCSVEDAKCKRSDDLIHVVYAGTFDPRKGIFDVINMSRYLPRNYCLHVLGFGTNDEVVKVRDAIDTVCLSREKNVYYDGLIVGKEFSEFLLKCHIGLAYQSANAKFNATSFPSKILTYLAHGLNVVASDIEAVKNSSVAPFIHMLESNDPKKLAAKICSIDFSGGSSTAKSALSTLDNDAKRNMRSMLHNLID